MDAAIGHKPAETGNSAWRGWTVNPPDKMETMKWIKGVMSLHYSITPPYINLDKSRFFLSLSHNLKI